MKKTISKFFWDSTVYKMVCVSTFILIPSIVFCFFPQVISVILLVWGAMFLVRDLFKSRNFTKQTGSILLLLFCIGYIFSLVFYAKNDLVSTVHVYCWTIIEFFLLFAIEDEKATSVDNLLYEMYKINILVSIVAFFAGVISLIIFFCKISIAMPDPEGVNTFWAFGISSGRNSGIFNNPIPCANAMFLGCVASLFNMFFPKKRKRILMICYSVVFIVCYLCVLTTLTRTYVYGIYIFLFITVVSAFYQKMLSDKIWLKRLLTPLCLAIIITCAAVGLSETTRNVMAKLISNVNTKSIILVAAGDEDKNLEDNCAEDVVGIDTEILKDEIAAQLEIGTQVTMNRDELNRLPSFLYPRDEMWKVALEVIPHSPILGFTSGNRQASSVEYSTSEYMKNRTGISTYHNAYLDIAVSAGLLGLSLMLIFLGVQIFRTVKGLFTAQVKVSQDKTRSCYSVLMGYLATHVFVTSMFFGVLCFSNVSVCLYFWIVLGIVSRIVDCDTNRQGVLSVKSIISRALVKR